jgi:hypothetical protein
MMARDLWRELGRPQPPRTIWQRPFDYDPRHFHSLCRLAESYQRTEQELDAEWAFPSQFPDPGDLGNYAHDLSYEEEIQPDLLVFLLPVCLRLGPWICSGR